MRWGKSKFCCILAVVAAAFFMEGSVNCFAAEANVSAGTPIVQMSSMYTYDEMCQDMVELAAVYPDYIHIASSATTVLGRNIPYMILGDVNATSSVMIQGSIHAREYLCTQVIMKMAETYAANKTCLGNVNFYIVPMANPDGVSIAQLGVNAASDEATRNFISLTGHNTDWKANAMGVDLNRNFDTGWACIDQHIKQPSYMLYKGTMPNSEIEVQSLIVMASSKAFSAFVSYHMAGNCIYYDEPGNTASNSAASALLATTLSGTTGYKMVNLKSCVSSSGCVVQGGFTDWAQLTFDKPAVTLELGKVLPPDGQKYVSSIYEQNLSSWEKIAQLYQ